MIYVYIKFKGKCKFEFIMIRFCTCSHGFLGFQIFRAGSFLCTLVMKFQCVAASQPPMTRNSAWIAHWAWLDLTDFLVVSTKYTYSDYKKLKGLGLHSRALFWNTVPGPIEPPNYYGFAFHSHSSPFSQCTQTENLQKANTKKRKCWAIMNEIYFGNSKNERPNQLFQLN